MSEKGLKALGIRLLVRHVIPKVFAGNQQKSFAAGISADSVETRSAGGGLAELISSLPNSSRALR